MGLHGWLSHTQVAEPFAEGYFSNPAGLKIPLAITFAFTGDDMSKMTPYSLQCPYCGHTQETMVWASLNVTQDPELKARLYAAEINRFDCEQCQKQTFINAPLLYHDMTMQFCVQYYPPEALDDEDFHRHFNADGSVAMTGLPASFATSGEYLTKPHIVFDMSEMIRYVAFRDHVAEANRK